MIEGITNLIRHFMGDRVGVSLKLHSGLLTLFFIESVQAGEVSIIAADLKQQSNHTWSLNVTLEHGDTGWDHYADNWRLVDSKGQVLGDRILYHPHVTEQPFTRSLSGIQIPDSKLESGEILFIEAHDKVHGWTDRRLVLDLSKRVNGRLSVR